jgi:hypothetical protein
LPRKTFAGMELSKVGSVENLRDLFTKRRNKLVIGKKNEYDDINENLKLTIGGNLFLMYDSGFMDENRIVIFSTNLLLEILGGAETWLGDGTFRIAPREFLQVYTLHCMYFGVRIPTAFILMKKKSEDHMKKRLKKFED